MSDSEIIYSEDVTIIVTEAPPEVVIVTEPEPEIHIIHSIEIGPPGRKGDKGDSGEAASEIKGYFSWGSVSSILIKEFAKDNIIHTIKVAVTEVFNGVGTAITIGTDADPDLLVVFGDVDLRVVGVYIISPAYKLPATIDIKLFYTSSSGASTGSGEVVINY